MQYGVLTKEAYFKDSDGKITEITVTTHTGMFQDSYLVTDFDNGKVDFRYWDYPRGIKPYHWSDGLSAIRIENTGKYAVSYTHLTLPTIA